MTSSSDISVGDVFMDQVVERLLGFAQTVPEVNGGVRVLGEELPESIYYRQRVGLV